jgi:acetoacetyl-CoA synthetase
VHPSSRTIETLIPIWERVLAQSPIEAGDDFFTLGGDASSADRLFSEVARVHGQELPPWVIYQTPTVRALAALIDATSPPLFPPLVQLKPGSDALPVFMAHGMGGSILEFFELVRKLDTHHPVYGMQTKGSDGLAEPFTRIEEMAEFFLDAIRQLQPLGPYLLIGYSLGGLVVWEMAQQLSRAGEDVPLLVLLDSYPHEFQLSLGQRMRLIAKRARRGDFTLTPSQKRLSSAVEVAEGNLQNRPKTGRTFAQASEHVLKSSYLALQRYRPSFYKGKVKFVRAAIPTDFPKDPAAVWAGLAEKLEVETVPGDHHGMLRSYSEDLALVLCRYLRALDPE